MHPHSRRLTCFLASLTATLTAAAALAGPLNPPAGAVTSTAKPLAEIEPRTAISLANTPGDADSLYRITQPGSYYLTGNLQGVVGKHGIEIAVSGVTLDLCGFRVDGAGGDGSFAGVFASSQNIISIVVRNGLVHNWAGDGVDLATFFTLACRVENVTSTSNGGDGISLGFRSTAVECVAYTNSANGFTGLTGAMCTACAAYGSTGAGFSVASGSTITGCTSGDNQGSGIVVGTGSTVSNCTSYSNNETGIASASGSLIAGCSVRGNGLDGIAVSSNCLVRDNTVSSNGGIGDGANILITGGDTRVERNNCSGADRGIAASGSSNFIAGNTVSGATLNWDIAANNYCLVIAATASAAISGNAGGVSPGSTSPWANFTY